MQSGQGASALTPEAGICGPSPEGSPGQHSGLHPRLHATEDRSAGPAAPRRQVRG